MGHSMVEYTIVAKLQLKALQKISNSEMRIIIPLLLQSQFTACFAPQVQHLKLEIDKNIKLRPKV